MIVSLLSTKQHFQIMIDSWLEKFENWWRQTQWNSIDFKKYFKLWHDIFCLLEFILWTCLSWRTCNMHHLTNWKNPRKHPVFKDKSDDNKKVVIVRKNLWKTLWSQQFSANFCAYSVIVNLLVKSSKKL